MPSVLAHTSTGAASNPTTSGINTVGASLLFAVASADQGQPAPTISDSLSNSWTSLSEFKGSHASVRAFYVSSPTTGTAQTVTITAATSAVAFLAIGGTAGNADQTNGAGVVGSVTSAQPGSITPSVGGEIIISGLAINSPAQTVSIDSGFAIVEQLQFSAGAYYGIAVAYLVQGSAAAVNPTWSWTTGTDAAADVQSFQAVVSSLLMNIGAGPVLVT